jgi:hypothetical protein
MRHSETNDIIKSSKLEKVTKPQNHAHQQATLLRGEQ